MSYSVYKIIHILGLVLFFSQFALAAGRTGKNTLQTILTGVALVMILVSGMGLLARLGISHNFGWPLWVKAKFGIWLVIGFSGHFVLKRFARFASAYYWAIFFLLGLAAYFANYKPL